MPPDDFEEQGVRIVPDSEASDRSDFDTLPAWPLDETAHRRPDFVPGEPVKLADGQEWQLRRPLVSFEPYDSDEGFRVCLSLEDDDTFQEMLDTREAAFDKDKADWADSLIGIEIAIAKRLLLANYDLDSKAVGRLIKLAYTPESNPRAYMIREAIMDVAEGRGPKASGDGDES